VEKMGKISSPLQLKDTEGKLGVLFKLLMFEGSKKQLFDTDKMVAINLKKEESIVFMDRDGNLWELSRNKNGRYLVRRLRDKKHGT
jgi:hypothetical protein